MSLRKRHTQQERRAETRARLIEAAADVFARRGFESASVEDISAAAGLSRGAFYSNFADKDELLQAAVDKRRLNIVITLEDICRRHPNPPERIAAVREWFINQWRRNDATILRTELDRRAMRTRAVRKRMRNLWTEEFKMHTDLVAQYLAAVGTVAAKRPETVALVFTAILRGLGSIALEATPEIDCRCSDAARLVFDWLTTPSVQITGNVSV